MTTATKKRQPFKLPERAKLDSEPPTCPGDLDAPAAPPAEEPSDCDRVEQEHAARGEPAVPPGVYVAIGLLAVHPDNPRRHHENGSLEGLAQSIREQRAHGGVLEPLLVRKDPAGGEGFQVLAGSRRLAAAKMVGLERVPVRMLECNDEQAIEVMLIENLQRLDVHPLEEAEGILLLHKQCGREFRDIATRLGKSVGYVHGRAKLAGLQPDVKKAWAKGLLELGHVLVFAPLQAADQDALLHWMLKGDNWQGPQHEPKEGIHLTVDDLRRHVHEDVLCQLARAPWKLNDANLLPAAGACTECPFRSGAQVELFPGAGKDRCTKPACFGEKRAAWSAQEISREEAKAGAPLVRVALTHRTPPGEKVLSERAYVQIRSKSDRCKHLQRAVGLDEHGTVERLLDVCVAKACAKHRPPEPKARSSSKGGGSSGETWQERQRRQDLARAARLKRAQPIRDAMAGALRAALAAGDLGRRGKTLEAVAVPRALLDEVAAFLLERLNWRKAELWKTCGFKASDPSNLEPAQLLRFLLEARIIDWSPRGDDGRWQRRLEQFASAGGVDLKPALAAVKAQQREAKKAARKGRTSKAKAAKAAKKGKAPPRKPGAARRARKAAA